MRIELTIKTDYLPSWGTWEGVRELVQNGRDAEVEHKAPLVVTFKDGTLVIENEGVELPHEALLMGHTTKVGKSDLIGQFGEGLKLGILALVRAGHDVSVYSGDEEWRPVIEASEKFKAQVLCFYISHHRKAARPKVRVEIQGIQADAWKDMRECFLFLNERKGDDSMKTPDGTLLLAPRMKGKIYIKGIFVTDEPSFRYGYDLVNAKLDRDRRMVNRWDLRDATARVWAQALRCGSEADIHDQFIKLLGLGTGEASEEVASFQYNADVVPGWVKETLVYKFVQKHGEDAIPVNSFGDSKDLAHLGKKGVVVNPVLAAILAGAMETADDVKAQLRTEIVKRYNYGDLNATQRRSWEGAMELLRKVEPEAPSFEVVDFRAKDLEGLCKEGDGLFIAKKMLSSVEEALGVMVHELAHTLSGAEDGDKRHVATIEKLWKEIVGHLRH